MKNSTVIKATGKSLEEWSTIIQDHNKGDLSHKEIADFLHKECGLTPWWAQEVTVLYEKNIGRRVTGQTKDSGFQLGISKTLPVSKEKLWDFITSPEGFNLIVEDEIHADKILGIQKTGKTGVEFKITTFKPYSHMRLQWRLPTWDSYSILQIRVTEKKIDKTTLTFHQEKMMNDKIREAMKQYWQERLENLESLLSMS